MVRKILALLIGAGLLMLGLLFSIVLFAVVGVIAFALWGYTSWKKKRFRPEVPAQEPMGLVIEGESIVVDESRTVEASSTQVRISRQ